MNRDNDYRRNGSGYLDPTAYKAIDNIYRREKKKDTDKEYTNRCILLRKINKLCKIFGFEIVGKITLKSVKTGRIFK